MHHQLIRGWLPGVGQPGNEMPPRGRLGVGSRSRGAAPDPDWNERMVANPIAPVVVVSAIAFVVA